MAAPSVAQPSAPPSLPLMHAAFLLAGLGTLLLGPILPLLALRWHLTDAGSGALVLAQFCGATIGGATISARLVRGLRTGLAAAGLGLTGFALAPSILPAAAALLVAGFGIGRIIATVNILAGQRYTGARGVVLTQLNFTWSLGALLSPVLAAGLTPRVALPTLLAALAGLFLGLFAVVSAQSRGLPETSVTTQARTASLTPRVFAYFAGLILLYGGVETALSAWLTTYALRYGGASPRLGAYTLVLLLGGLTLGRALASLVVARLGEVAVQRGALLLSIASTAALALAGRPGGMALFAVLLGLCLAPVFPATFALMMAARPSARQAGIGLAASGIGAAALPWGMGLVSVHTGSLRLALALPIAAAVLMLGLALLRPDASGRSEAGAQPTL